MTDSVDESPDLDAGYRPESHAVISVVGVSKTFRSESAAGAIRARLARRDQEPDFVALNDITFDVFKGETFGILGHNGSGKSTMLKLLAGIMPSSAGTIRIEGRLSALLELGAGFHPELSGRENTYLNASILGIDSSFVTERLDDIVRFAELEQFIDLPIKHYSSGMRSRLGFAVAIHLRPDILLIDEVLAVGDMAFQEKCLSRISDLRSAGRTLVLVSHSPGRVIELCDRAMVLDRGCPLHVGIPAKAVEAYREAMANRGSKAASTTPRRQPGSQGKKSRRVQILSAGLEARSVVGEVSCGGHVDGPATIDPGGRLECWADVESAVAMEVRVRVLIRIPGGLAMVNRSTANLAEPVAVHLQAGQTRVGFTFADLGLESGHYNIALFVESPDGKKIYAVRAPVGELRVAGGVAEGGPLKVELAFEASGVGRSDQPGSKSLSPSGRS